MDALGAWQTCKQATHNKIPGPRSPVIIAWLVGFYVIPTLWEGPVLVNMRCWYRLLEAMSATGICGAVIGAAAVGGPPTPVSPTTLQLSKIS